MDTNDLCIKSLRHNKQAVRSENVNIMPVIFVTSSTNILGVQILSMSVKLVDGSGCRSVPQAVCQQFTFRMKMDPF